MTARAPAGVSVLAVAGLLDGLRATMHRGLTGDLRRLLPGWRSTPTCCSSTMAGPRPAPASRLGSLTLDDLAADAAMSTRTFSRRFRDETVTRAARWLVERRGDLARHLLGTITLPIDRVAAEAGFGKSVRCPPRSTRPGRREEWGDEIVPVVRSLLLPERGGGRPGLAHRVARPRRLATAARVPGDGRSLGPAKGAPGGTRATEPLPASSSRGGPGSGWR